MRIFNHSPLMDDYDPEAGEGGEIEEAPEAPEEGDIGETEEPTEELEAEPEPWRDAFNESLGGVQQQYASQFEQMQQDNRQFQERLTQQIQASQQQRYAQQQPKPDKHRWLGQDGDLNMLEDGASRDYIAMQRQQAASSQQSQMAMSQRMQVLENQYKANEMATFWEKDVGRLMKEHDIPDEAVNLVNSIVMGKWASNRKADYRNLGYDKDVAVLSKLIKAAKKAEKKAVTDAGASQKGKAPATKGAATKPGKPKNDASTEEGWEAELEAFGARQAE